MPCPPPKQIEPAVLTVREVMIYLGISRATFHRKDKAGAGCFESFLDGGRRKVTKRSLDELIEKKLAEQKQRNAEKKLAAS